MLFAITIEKLKLKKVLSSRTLLTSYLSLFQSLLMYVIFLWDNSTHASKASCMARRITAGASCNEHCQRLLENLMSFRCHAISFTIFLWKFKKGKTLIRLNQTTTTIKPKIQINFNFPGWSYKSQLATHST